MNYINEQDIYLKWAYFSDNTKNLDKYYDKIKKDFDKEDVNYSFKEYVERNRFSEKSLSYIDEIDNSINKKIKEEIEKIKSKSDFKKFQKINENISNLYVKEVLLSEKVPLNYVQKEDFLVKLKNNTLNLLSDPKVKIGLTAAGISLAAASGVGPVALSLIAVSRGTSLWLSLGGADKLAEKINPSLDNYIEKNKIENKPDSEYKKIISNVLKNNKFKIGAGIALGIVSLSATSVASAMTDLSSTIFEIENGSSRIIDSAIESNKTLPEWNSEVRNNHYYLDDETIGYTDESFQKAYIDAKKDFNILNNVDKGFNSELYTNNLESILNEIKHDIYSGNIDLYSMTENERLNYINGIIESKGLDKDIKLDLKFDYKSNFDFHLDGSFTDENGVTHLNLCDVEEIKPSYAQNHSLNSTKDHFISDNFYVVEKNDNLWKIARKTFENGELEMLASKNLPIDATPEQVKNESLRILHNRVNQIIIENPQISNPDLIFPDQKINIPKFNTGHSLELKKDINLIKTTNEVDLKSLENMLPNDQLKVSEKEELRKYLNDKEYKIKEDNIHYNLENLKTDEKNNIIINDSVKENFNKKFKR